MRQPIMSSLLKTTRKFPIVPSSSRFLASHLVEFKEIFNNETDDTIRKLAYIPFAQLEELLELYHKTKI